MMCRGCVHVWPALASLSFSSNDGCAESPSVCVFVESCLAVNFSLLSFLYLLLSLCLAGAYRFDGGGGGGGCTVPALAAVAVCLCLPACVPVTSCFRAPPNDVGSPQRRRRRRRRWRRLRSEDEEYCSTSTAWQNCCRR